MLLYVNKGINISMYICIYVYMYICIYILHNIMNEFVHCKCIISEVVAA